MTDSVLFLGVCSGGYNLIHSFAKKRRAKEFEDTLLKEIFPSAAWSNIISTSTGKLELLNQDVKYAVSGDGFFLQQQRVWLFSWSFL